jgi:hypothetical protein
MFLYPLHDAHAQKMNERKKIQHPFKPSKRHWEANANIGNVYLFYF